VVFYGKASRLGHLWLIGGHPDQLGDWLVTRLIHRLWGSRLYIGPYDLSPTYSEVHNKFSVRYFLNLVLVDEEDRR
jgi:hypothetical protein